MKYSSFKLGFQDNLTMAVVCHACKAKLAGTENFCPECGAKLKKIPLVVKAEEVVDLLNDAGATGTQKKVPGKKQSVPDANIISKTTGRQDGWSVATTAVDHGCCVRGYVPSNFSECPFRKANICTAIVCTSLPPQYPVCQFFGSGFVKCSEVDHQL